MRLCCPLDRSLSRPLRIGASQEDSENGPRLGGRPPKGLDLSLLSPDAKYVLTVPVCEDPALDLSVFVNCAFRTFVGAMNNGAQSDDRVRLLLHAPTPRGTALDHGSRLSEHPIYIGEPEQDLTSNDDGGFMFHSGHKLGGRPYCIQELEFPDLARLEKEGFLQLLQVDFPAESDVRGSWPFMDGLFNVFGRTPFAGTDLLWALQK